VLVHGDTTTSFIAALAAFNRQLPIGHVEAGLRTGNLRAPWPEEANRRLTGVITDLHFPPTSKSAANLLREGVPEDNIEITGNTVIDALLWMRKHQQEIDWHPPADSPLAALDDQRRMILVTSHRRENLGDGFRNICQALAELAEQYPDVQFVYPVHLNPLVQEVVYGMLADKPNIYLVPPQDYPNFVWLMGRAHFILTDSGGVQEEAPAIGKPLLVLRDVTERPSVLESGTMLLVGTDKARIVKEARQLLDDPYTYARMSRVHFPYGDGHASELIATRLHAWLSARSAAGKGV
jgi:UDP-N-acetylglucosamine 2-epimerase (non-hydrolysing)